MKVLFPLLPLLYYALVPKVLFQNIFYFASEIQARSKYLNNITPLINKITTQESSKLSENRLTDQTPTKKLLFNMFLKINAIDSFQAGEYELFNNLQENFIAFSKGDTKNNIFIIKEGTNLYELQNQIEESGLINDCHLLKCINSEFTYKEGILFPNTYFYKWNMKASSLLNKSHNTQISILDNLWMNKNSNNPLKTKYEACLLYTSPSPRDRG